MFRGRFKASAVSKVIAYYNLNPSSPDKNAVLMGKLLTNKRYIYLSLKVSYRVFFFTSPLLIVPRNRPVLTYPRRMSTQS